MEKKKYEMPIVAVANIEAESFCAASILNTLNSETEIAGESMLSKENKNFDIWGGDEEE